MTTQLTVVCAGWGIEHGLIVLKEGDPDRPVSHGMCKRCQLLTDAEDRLDPIRFEEYRMYLQNLPVDNLRDV